MFHVSCRRVSKILNISMEPISKLDVHYLSKIIYSKLKIVLESRYRRCIAIDETELKVEKTIVYVWSTVDVDSKKLLTLEASYCRNYLNTLKLIH
ncbi:MAG: hypothetical protein QW118_04200 [Nitrososphaerota archaeon]